MGTMQIMDNLHIAEQAALGLVHEELANGFEFLAFHHYHDETGKHLHSRIRLKHPTTGKKWIRPFSLQANGYAFGEPSYPSGKPLYNLHALHIDPSACVFVVEGEACVEVLQNKNLLATTSGSADSAASANWQALAGRDVIVWPDNDARGLHYLQEVTKILQGLGCALRVVDIAALNLPEKGDVVDWLQSHPHASSKDILALPSKPYIAPVKVSAQATALPRHRTWAEPMPIQAALPPVPAFDADTLLPEALRAWVMDEADRMPCAPDFIAAAVLVSLGTTIGARCAIQPKSRDSWQVIPNLWGGMVGLPSAKKSPAAAAALTPIERLCQQALEAYEAENAAFEAQKMVYEAQDDALAARIKSTAKSNKSNNSAPLESIAKELLEHRQQAPQAPTARRYKTNDSTVEKLGELLRDNPAGLMVMRDELVGLIASWSKEGREGERAFYLEAWNGNASFATDRIARGSILIPNLCLSVFGGIQPDVLTRYLEQASNALANDGMLQRFQLLVYPDQREWEWRDHTPSKPARDAAFAVFDALAHFVPENWGATPADEMAKFPYFHFDEAAQEIFRQWSHDLHCQRLPQEEQPMIAQHLTKFDKLFPALALIFHLVDCVANEATAVAGAVTEQAALRAAAWCEYLEAHARRCYGLLADDGLRAAQALADKIKQGKLADYFTARDVRRNQWRYLTSEEAVQAALDWLEDEHWLIGEQVGGIGAGSGRRTTRYLINPQALKAAKNDDYSHRIAA